MPSHYSELGIRLYPQQKDEHKAEIFNDLHMRKSDRNTKPLP